MEKRTDIPGRKPRLVITGPESTGKTSLSIELAGRKNGLMVPEYARSYLEKLNRAYTRHDLEHIAREQIRIRNEYSRKLSKWIIFDTDLIITRVWFDEVYNYVPDWLETEIIKNKMDLYLLCSTEPAWVEDPLRENGGERRLYLYRRYEAELRKYELPFCKISGLGEQRVQNAMDALQLFFG